MAMARRPGNGTRLSVASVTSPRVPSAPTKILCRCAIPVSGSKMVSTR
ncbi:MAG: hypothetical protein BWY79_01310 [Actinobacteria bacterium ADurb.Bin444]|nr:MAG: hypothetical protein BWY79_01310 [Actinobacteria bacterium ADurb.Bin444]